MDEDGESSKETAVAASSFEGAQGEGICHVCYKCYGRRFFQNENYFVNTEKKRLTAQWHNRRKKSGGYQ